MATERVLAEAVQRVLDSAVVDPEGPTHPRDERCGFDRTALDGLVALCASGSNRDVVVSLIEADLSRAVEALDPDRALAAMVLRTRVVEGTRSRLVPVENINGDVGAGSG